MSDRFRVVQVSEVPEALAAARWFCDCEKHGGEGRWCMRPDGWALVEFDGERAVRVVGQDGGEPEDQLLVRDWSWVADEMNAQAARVADLEAQLAAATRKVEVVGDYAGKLDADLERVRFERDALRDELQAAVARAEAAEERRFPILDGPSIPWSVIAPHARQADRNHGQTLDHLARRGGLGAIEAVAVLEDKKYPWGADTEAEKSRCLAVLNGINAERDALRADLARVTALRAASDKVLASGVVVSNEKYAALVRGAGVENVQWLDDLLRARSDLASARQEAEALRGQVEAQKVLLDAAASALTGYDVVLGKTAADQLLEQQARVADVLHDYLYAPPGTGARDKATEWIKTYGVDDHIVAAVASAPVTATATQKRDFPWAVSSAPSALSAPAPVPAPPARNQCDGCATAAPLESGAHRQDGTLVACTADRYAPPAPDALAVLREARDMIAASGPTPHPHLSEAEIETMFAKIDAALDAAKGGG